MSLYSEAVLAIQNRVESVQMELDKAAVEARNAHIQAMRQAAVEGVTDPAELAVCQLVSSSICIGRESDGFPDIYIDQKTVKVVAAAVDAGIFPWCRTYKVGGLNMLKDGSGINGCQIHFDNDFAAWKAASNYRNNNAKHSL